jgi:putative zinc finger/helix-turn-helix YgiT family protein
MEKASAQKLIAEVRGEQFEIEVLAQRCSHCGRVMLDSRARRMHYRKASDAYRAKHGLLTAPEIDRLRRNLGMTWKQFADFVQIGIATLKRWMAGEIQTPSLDALVRLKADLSSVQQAATDLVAILADKCDWDLELNPRPVMRFTKVASEWTESAAADSQYAFAA